MGLYCTLVQGTSYQTKCVTDVTEDLEGEFMANVTEDLVGEFMALFTPN